MSDAGGVVVARDRVLPATRALSIVIIPFLLVAFVLLFFWPSANDTARLFAWRIVPDFTSMVLGSVYLGGAYFFFRAATATQWHRVGGGFIPVGLFASLMAVATIAHWGKFIHTNIAFWLWVTLYFTTPFLVFAAWLWNRREQFGRTDGDPMLRPRTTLVIGVAGVAAVATCVFLFLTPRAAIAIWPWSLTELTARVMGAIFALGAAGLGAFTDKRWTSMRILLQVAGVMLVLIFIAAVRARSDFDTTKPLTWVFAAGFLGMAVGTAILYTRMERAARTSHAGP
ncbi:hypothetical protein SAMN04515671_4562 [Nakamurella panacisegetis]|uniref:Uncharacterized protein n=2 Tax=Nakamurella panacisegetis TaxID=1090615 RepID=A0A1H0TA56_9ACTN|nr:hypothetical protein SAMN04515671_4562 [Nakamurella panacisegetis]